MTALLASVLVIAGCAHGGGRSPSALPTAEGPQPAVVQTASGAVRGVVAPGYRVFDGIPYAAPPVGPLRWAPPAPPASWPGVRDATRPGLRCPRTPAPIPTTVAPPARTA